MTCPGDNTDFVVELFYPFAVDEGSNFSIREGGRTVGAGTVIKITK